MNYHDILIVGNYCHDTLINDRGVFAVLGGSTAYSSAVLDGLGADFEVIAKVGEDFLYPKEARRPARIIAGRKTTHFIDDYTSGEREATVAALCDPIDPADIDGRARVAIAGAVAGEILPDTLRELRLRCETLICDIQGLIREIVWERPDAGRVRHVSLDETPFRDLVGSIDFLKISLDEARVLNLEELRRKTHVILTDEARGCLLLDEETSLNIPGFPVEVKDHTGAGDCFLAGFAYGISRGLEPARAARLANYCGALAVSQIGIPRLTREDFRAFIPSESGSSFSLSP